MNYKQLENISSLVSEQCRHFGSDFTHNLNKIYSTYYNLVVVYFIVHDA